MRFKERGLDVSWPPRNCGLPYYFITLLFSILFTLPISAQVVRSGTFEPLENVGEPSAWLNLINGLDDATSPWDISILLIGLAGTFDGFYSIHHIDFPQIKFDLEFSDAVARSDGGLTIGSRLGPDHIGWTIFSAQLASTLFLDTYSKKNITKDNYVRTFMFGKALCLNMFITELVKSTVNRRRPDGTDDRSFFSGHTSTTFTFSSYVYREIDDWIDIRLPGDSSNSNRFIAKTVAFSVLFGWSSYVGYSRIYDRKHYLTDIIAGATVGTLIGNLMYSAYLSKSKQNNTIKDNSGIHISPDGAVIFLIPL